MSDHIRDLRYDLKGAIKRLAERALGSLELAYVRGYQAGYEKAMEDAKHNRLRAVNACLPSRASRTFQDVS